MLSCNAYYWPITYCKHVSILGKGGHFWSSKHQQAFQLVSQQNINFRLTHYFHLLSHGLRLSAAASAGHLCVTCPAPGELGAAVTAAQRSGYASASWTLRQKSPSRDCPERDRCRWNVTELKNRIQWLFRSIKLMRWVRHPRLLISNLERW